jgi:hypothetical protein
MNRTYYIVRFKLFTQSYAGKFLLIYLKNSSFINIAVQRLARALLFKDFMLYRFIIMNKYQQQIFKIKVKDNNSVNTERVSIYLQIEHELFNLARMKKNKSTFSEFEYEYGNTLLSLAIERVAGNNLKNIKDDSEFERKLTILIKSYQHWYYCVAYRYKLPTLRILPYILRLIST